jgi:hypothetical protein
LGKLPDLRFLSRRNLEYSFTGEKLSAQQLCQAFALLRNKFTELSPEVFLTCFPSQSAGDLLPHYKLVVVGVTAPGDEIAACCDGLLQEMNVEYGNKRRSGRLAAMQFEHLSFDDFIASAGSETQFKFLPLYLRTWEDLVRESDGVLCV